ncbi:MAG: hypothetical protein U1A22_11230 [Xanthomonadaceae bacterium]|nr:hypothetical protein [Xanthomonadaceae bacterium]
MPESAQDTPAPDHALTALAERLCELLAPMPDNQSMAPSPPPPSGLSEPRLVGLRVLAPILDRLSQSRFGCDLADASDVDASAVLTDCFAERSLRPVLIGLLDFAIERAFAEGSSDRDRSA